MTLSDNPALLLIDIQKGLNELAYYGGNRNNPRAEERAAELLAYWRAHQLPVIHVKHNGSPPSPLAKGTPGNDFKEIIRPNKGEPIFEKEVNSAFIGTELDAYLKKEGIGQLVLVGLTTAHCISSTARMAGNFGYDTYIISDATATFDTLGNDGRRYDASLVHDICLATLKDEFAAILDTASLLDQL
ncbi:cysteine hydrolase family protein [uncultured Muriicola sp.]|uniref:cysteine hydrolase family protein n=1 Tax=uncultured Muriicola sp. TaxID=1583102 RepID=UPI00262852AF|nr:cysteine hydrolase family protein [uncultured Muriicola sp.]